MSTRLLLQLVALAAICCVNLARADCEIIDKRPARVGVEKGVQGRCSNNGESITCTLGDEGEGINCSGPEGQVSGDNMRNLVRNACGCDAMDQSPGNLERQLEAYP